MRIISSPDMPKANGHYSHCLEHNGVLYLAGQLPKHPDTGEIPEGIEAQTLLTLENMERVLVAAGSDRTKVLRVRLYIPNVDLWDQVNKVYSTFFGDHMPARAVIPTRDLHFGALVEIEATAVV